jgi:hypothetical protein
VWIHVKLRTVSALAPIQLSPLFIKLIRNMYKVCAAERYALNKQSTKKHKITMWLTKFKYCSKRTVQNITTRIDKGNPSWSTRSHPLFYLCSCLLIFAFLCILLLLIFVLLLCLFRFAIVLLAFQFRLIVILCLLVDCLLSS